MMKDLFNSCTKFVKIYTGTGALTWASIQFVARLGSLDDIVLLYTPTLVEDPQRRFRQAQLKLAFGVTLRDLTLAQQNALFDFIEPMAVFMDSPKLPDQLQLKNACADARKISQYALEETLEQWRAETRRFGVTYPGDA